MPVDCWVELVGAWIELPRGVPFILRTWLLISSTDLWFAYAMKEVVRVKEVSYQLTPRTSSSVTKLAEPSLWQAIPVYTSGEDGAAAPPLVRDICTSHAEYGIDRHYLRYQASFYRRLVPITPHKLRAKSITQLSGKPCLLQRYFTLWPKTELQAGEYRMGNINSY